MTWNLVTYADEKFEDKQEYLNSIAEKCGFNTIPFTREGIESSLFYKENKEILDNPVGNGYWAWKPYIILNAMNRLNDGDIVLYGDCGDMFHPNINKYVDDLLDEDDQCSFSWVDLRMVSGPREIVLSTWIATLWTIGALNNWRPVFVFGKSVTNPRRLLASG